MPELELAQRLGLLVALALFLGLAFEEVYKRDDRTSPGGVRTFPLLALAGAMLYLVEPAYALAFVAGLVALGLWLYGFMRGDRVAENSAEPTLMVPASNLVAYLLGPIALTQPLWVPVAVTVAAVLLLGGRERIHGFARRVPREEIHTAGMFLLLAGVILPLVPDAPIIPAATVTPYRVWLAVVLVCAVSYASYLAQRYAPTRHGTLVPALLGGLYSSTAVTVALARQQREAGAARPELTAGILGATTMMYLRVAVLILLFNPHLAAVAAPALVPLVIAGAMFAWSAWRKGVGAADRDVAIAAANPLQVTTALTFAALFVAVSLASSWVQRSFGAAGVLILAVVVGAADVDPFVLSLAQGGAPAMTDRALAAAVLIATSANNVVKAVFAGIFGGFAVSRATVMRLAALAGLGLSAAALYLI